MEEAASSLYVLLTLLVSISADMLLRRLPPSWSEGPASDATASAKMPAKRPLRTYSKRTQSDRDGEPVLKRRRTEEQEDNGNRKRRSSEHTSVVGSPKVPSPRTTASATRGSTIMHYFRPVAPSSSSRTTTPKLSSEIDQPASSPASSPPIVTQKAKREHSVQRVGSDRQSHNLTNGSDTETNEESHEAASESSDAAEGGLKECSDTILNRQLPLGRNRDKPRKRAKPTTKKKTSVQTTLSLTMDANFTECKVCNILYNPYHAEDAKIHARRHAAIIRRRNREVN